MCNSTKKKKFSNFFRRVGEKTRRAIWKPVQAAGGADTPPIPPAAAAEEAAEEAAVEEAAVELEEPPQAVRTPAAPTTAEAFIKSRREIIFIILFSFIRISQHLMEYTYMYVPWFLFVL